MANAKSVLITGASRGIGAGIAREFARAGYAVLINYRMGKEAAEKLVHEIKDRFGTTADCYGADVADPAACRAMAEWAERRYGPVEVLVNNAGVAESRLVTDVTDEDYRRMVDVNFGGVFFTTRALLPAMVRRKRGAIVNISSIWGTVGASCECLYSATKAAVIGFTKALAKEAGPSGIRVNAICPGVIDTDMCRSLTPAVRRELAASSALNRLGTPEDVASLALFLAGEGADFITGQIITADGGFV